VAAASKPLSAMVDALPQAKYVTTPELRFDCTDAAKFAIVDSVREHFRARYDVVDVDGVRVQFGDGWGLIRASNTQPVLVVRFEAKSRERLQAIAHEVSEALAAYPEVTIPALSI
jgi:phosphomannomutase/phosphoglucomutase